MRGLKTSLFAADRLAQMVATGGLAMPDFQRDFVWGPSQVVDFLESVANSWPTGSLLFLEAPPRGVRPIFASKGFKDGPLLGRGRPEYYVLDGQQRLTALYHAFFNASSESVYFVCTDGGDVIRAATRKRYGRLAAGGETQLISDLVGITSKATGEALHENSSKLRKLRKELPGFAAGEYFVPVVVLPWDVELAALAKIFETINRTGVRLNAFDLMVAVLFPQHFDLRQMWNVALANHEELVQFDVDGVQVLRLIALWSKAETSAQPSRLRVKGVRQSDILQVPAEFVQQRWEDAVRSFVRAIQFGRNVLGIVHPSLVPSESMLLTLAALLSIHKSTRNVPRWFWRSCLSQAHAQGANTQVVADFDSGGTRDTGQYDEVDVQELLAQPLARNAIAARGLACALVKAGAVDPVSGTPFSELEPVTEIQMKSITEIVGRDERPPVVGDLVLLRRGSMTRLREAIAQGDLQVLENLRSQEVGGTSSVGEALQRDVLDARVRFYSAFLGEEL